MINTEIARLQYDSARTNLVTKSTQSAQSGKKDEKLYEACQGFEAIFIKQMLNSMKSTINKAGLVDGGFAEEMYDDMLYDEYADKMAKTAGFGITESLYRQLSSGMYK